MHLSHRLGMPSSAATLLRIIRRQPLPIQQTPRVLGVDDWSFRRGHRYGTILCDLERRRVVDLLPERSSESFQAWLTTHPGVEVISRDRGDYYIKGAAAGAPQAIQVADRWHLLANLRESLVRIADRHPHELLVASRAVASPQPAQIALATKAERIHRKTSLTRLEMIQAERRLRRRQRYEKIKALRRQRVSLRKIARQLGLSRCTVRRYAHARQCPERDGRRYVRATDPFVEHLHQRWRMGCRNAAELFAELQQQGFSGSYNMVRRRVAAWRKRETSTRQACLSHNQGRLSANQVAWLLIKTDSTLTDQDRRTIQAIEAHCPTLGKASRLAKRFRTILREQKPQSLDAWLQEALRPEVAMELRRFAKGLYADLAAVRAAFALPWSNGQTEGQVNRLKMIKRQMFGRAKFDLLRHRVLEMGA
jgi:transposase